jgi:hypothetical protein
MATTSKREDTKGIAPLTVRVRTITSISGVSRSRFSAIALMEPWLADASWVSTDPLIGLAVDDLDVATLCHQPLQGVLHKRLIYF